jgi:TRAP-type C4-dicarboxylate transport system substrate-binding protein
MLISKSRRTFVSALAVAAATFSLASGASAQTTKWNLPAAYALTNYHTENLVQFGKDVAAATGGKLEITVHGNASLFKC